MDAPVLAACGSCPYRLHIPEPPPPLLLLSSTPKPFSRQVIRTLRRAGVLDKVGQDWVFVRVHDAVSYAQGLLAADKEGAHVVAKEDHDTITNKV